MLHFAVFYLFFAILLLFFKKMLTLRLFYYIIDVEKKKGVKYVKQSYKKHL